MIKYAAKKKIISFNPLAELERLVNDRRNLDIITPEEFKTLFVYDWKAVWNDDLVVYTANKLAALTGMRCSEVLGLTGEYLFEGNIFLNAQYDEYGYRETKTKIKHHIPLAAEMIGDLKELMNVNGTGFLFSLNGGATPVNRKTMYNGFNKALKNIGFTKEQIRERGLNLHAWRHFCNTELQKAGLSIQQVQAVTGHRSTRMTEWYTHFDPSQFGKVPEAQEKLLRREPEERPDRADGPGSGQVRLKLVKKPEMETPPRRKGAYNLPAWLTEPPLPCGGFFYPHLRDISETPKNVENPYINPCPAMGIFKHGRGRHGNLFNDCGTGGIHKTFGTDGEAVCA
jgi:site-specific recombinase XerD